MSELKVNKISPRSGTTLTIGDSGDTITVASGATLTGDLNADNLTSGTVPSARITGAYTGITNLTMSGDLTVDTNTLFVDASTNTVGIGTASPNALLHIKPSSGNSVFRIESANTDECMIEFSDPEDTNVGRIRYAHSDNHMQFITNASERMRIDSSGAMLLGTTTAGSASAGDLVVNGGVFLGGTATANELDDYEEGTFTPTFTSTSASFSYSYQNGYYTKIGRSVTCHIFIRGQSSGTTSNQLFISGLPFTSLNSVSLYASGSFGQIESVNYSGGVDINGHVSPNQSKISLQYSRDDNSALGLPASAVDKGTSSGFMFSINYFTD
jgi:hypothetical protein